MEVLYRIVTIFGDIPYIPLYSLRFRPEKSRYPYPPSWQHRPAWRRSSKRWTGWGDDQRGCLPSSLCHMPVPTYHWRGIFFTIATDPRDLDHPRKLKGFSKQHLDELEAMRPYYAQIHGLVGANTDFPLKPIVWYAICVHSHIGLKISWGWYTIVRNGKNHRRNLCSAFKKMWVELSKPPRIGENRGKISRGGLPKFSTPWVSDVALCLLIHVLREGGWNLPPYNFCGFDGKIIYKWYPTSRNQASIFVDDFAPFCSGTS